jgi:cobalt-zinc-cadmium efflux system outer membrane protein
MRIIFAIISLWLCWAPVRAASPLAQAFQQAWQRQPTSAALAARQQAAEAQLESAQSWTAAPASVDMGVRSDRFNRNQGARELEWGVVLPLWLPGEQAQTLAVAEAGQAALAGRMAALRLELARSVREAWWAWLLARHEVTLAAGRAEAAQRLRNDVSHRFQVGDLSRADLNQAEGVVAQARAAQAEAEANHALARYRLETLTGPLAVGDVALDEAEQEPDAQALPSLLAAHPRWQEVHSQWLLAQQQLELARVQARANPELALSTRYDRASAEQLTEQTWALSVRLPWGGGPRHQARISAAHAEALEAEVTRLREQERLRWEAEALRQQCWAAQQQVAAAQLRAQLAQQNRGFFDKSFRLGESDLPTRLRIEAEAFEAERALGAARLGLARTRSQYRQALGVLPE